MTAPAWDDLILVGRIARTHGLRGEVAVDVLSDFADDRFQVGKAFWTRGPQGTTARLAIASVRDHQERVLVRFEGVDAIEAAEALGKAELRVPADTLTALPEGTYHHHDMVGCEVVAEDGTAIGVVTGVDGHRVASHLVVQGRRGEVLVPLAESICVGFDLEARRITVALPEGLLDLN